MMLIQSIQDIDAYFIKVVVVANPRKSPIFNHLHKFGFERFQSVKENGAYYEFQDGSN